MLPSALPMPSSSFHSSIGSRQGRRKRRETRANSPNSWDCNGSQCPQPRKRYILRSKPESWLYYYNSFALIELCNAEINDFLLYIDTALGKARTVGYGLDTLWQATSGPLWICRIVGHSTATVDVNVDSAHLGLYHTSTLIQLFYRGIVGTYLTFLRRVNY